MANTLKFGNGEFATKEGSTLAYNDENGNFKPLPFTFDRSTSATRVNKEGLIEVVSNNEPRIDFLNDSKGALLLEPSRSNLVTYSEDFSNVAWQKQQSSVTPNATISPDGTLNASKLIEDNTSNFHRILEGIDVVSSDYSHTVFAKAGERKYFVLRNNISGTNVNACFDLEDGIVVYSGFDEAKIEYYGNGWYRCFIKETSTSTFLTSISLMTSDKEILNNNIPSYQGDGTSGLYIWGAQLEQGSYATSYIPTQGSIGTRVAESCEQTPVSGIIGQTEGSVYVEGTAILDANGSMPFTIYLNGSNILYAWFRTNGIIDIDVFANGLFQDRIRTSVDTISNGDYFKLSVGYKSNDLVAYLNGVQIGTASPTSIPSCSSLIVGGYIAADYTGSLIKETKLYNTKLSNTELQQLTS